MGEQKVQSIRKPDSRAMFIKHLLDDIAALELMLEKNLIETGINRIGAEQEFCLVNDNWRPSIHAPQILEAINDPHFTTELAKYNLEINLDPEKLCTNAFTKIENTLHSLLDDAQKAANKFNNNVILTGILPTISKNELEIDYMTPIPRYALLNEIMKERRGGDFELNIRGVDELSIAHDSMLFEACNTSFQTHLQISPEDFVSSYNWAQTISGPVLGICSNSPLLLGRELWAETRIALFRQSIDTRTSSYALKNQEARVTFGNCWSSGTAADIFKDDISRYKVILSREINDNSLNELDRGIIPKLRALNLHNGTIYRWNRPCYGVGNGKAHLRIENRYIPAGPTVVDEMSNFAFWVGLMMGRPEEYDNMNNCMDFRDAKSNFIKAARTGKASVMHWEDRLVSVRDLVTKEMLPIAYQGLRKMKIDQADIEKYLSIIEQRATSRTGAQWQIQNFRLLRQNMKQDDALLAVTKAIYDNQQTGKPVHEWPALTSDPKAQQSAYLVGHIMSTQLFTVHEKDLAELATNVMQWKNIHHVPVEDQTRKLVGLLTWSQMEHYRESATTNELSIVADIMETNVRTVSPETTIEDAIVIMKSEDIGCLPVIQHDQVVGIITIVDINELANG